MPAEIIQFIPRTEHLVRDLSEQPVVLVLPSVPLDRFFDDVQNQRPSDSDPSNEPA